LNLFLTFFDSTIFITYIGKLFLRPLSGPYILKIDLFFHLFLFLFIWQYWGMNSVFQAC
jgi:hypothetical protein